MKTAGIVLTLVALLLVITAPVQAGSIDKGFDSMDSEALHDTNVTFLGDNMSSWIARWNLIDSARTSIHATSWMLSQDTFGKSFLGLLLKKANEGVSIKLMVDARGSSNIVRSFKGRDYLQELVNTGNVDVRVYSPMRKIINESLFKYRSLLPIWASNHDKIIAVDGHSAIIGGRNIAKYYFIDVADKPDVYRDADVLLEGSTVVTRLLEAYDLEFYSKHISEVGKDFINFVKHDKELRLAKQLMETWMTLPALSDTESDLLLSSEDKRNSEITELFSLIDEPELAEKKYAVPLAQEIIFAPRLRGALNTIDLSSSTVKSTELRILDNTSGVNDEAFDTINENLIKLVESAEDEILIGNAYFVLTKKALKVFAAAGRRGVKITIMTNSPMGRSSLVTQAHFVKNWPEILAQVPNMRIFVFSEDHVKIHAKMAVFDNKVTAIGSYNIDLVSAQINSEVLAVVKSEEFARQCHKYIDNLINSEITEVLEYTIVRDEKGAATRDEQGNVIKAFGPEDHCDAKTLKKVEKARKVLDFLSKRLNGLAPLM